MLEFLTDFANDFSKGFSDSGGSLSGIMDIVKQFGGNGGYDPYNPEAGANEKRSAALYKALADPNNSLVKQLQQEEKQSGMTNFLNEIRQMQMADRRAQSMGKQGTFFAPDRADETVDYLTSRAQPKLSESGLDAARARITQSANGLRGLVDPEVARYNQGMTARGQQVEANNFKNILSSLAGNQQQPQYKASDIIWDDVPHVSNISPNSARKPQKRSGGILNDYMSGAYGSGGIVSR